MSLLQPAKNTSAFLKVGIFGFEKSGKTRTAMEIAIGMAKHIKAKKIAFFDTEKGSDFHVARVKEAGLEMDVIKSKTFVDLLEVIKEAEAGKYGCLVIDSLTHIWREITESYLKTKGRKYISLPDWNVLKTEWAQFTDLYIASKLHIIECGRAGYIYDTEEDENGKSQSVKTGVKMKGETESGYEPDLVLEMEKVVTFKKNKRDMINRCYVIGDRTDLLKGKSFDFPTFVNFLPVVKFLNIGGEHVGVDTTRTSQAIFYQSSDKSWAERQRRKEIILEEIDAFLTMNGFDGRLEDTKKARIDIITKSFGTASKTAIEGMKLEEVEQGFVKLKSLVPERPIEPKKEVKK